MKILKLPVEKHQDQQQRRCDVQQHCIKRFLWIFLWQLANSHASQILLDTANIWCPQLSYTKKSELYFCSVIQYNAGIDKSMKEV